MKLAEALIERKAVKERIDSLRDRLQNTVLIQEGDVPPESPAAMLDELVSAAARLELLIWAINRTNHETRLQDDVSLAEAIVTRDMLRLRRLALEQVVEAASPMTHRYSRNEVKFVNTLDIAELRRSMDQLARQWRELDARIQATNWETEVADFEA